MIESRPKREHTDITQQKYTYDLLCWRRLCTILRIIFPSLISRTSALFLLLLVNSVGIEFINYFVGLIPSKFYSVLGYQNFPRFLQETWKALLLIACVALAESTQQYISSLLCLQWRDLLTSYLHRLYLKHIFYYQLNVLQVGKIDNPDQRITSDVNQLCKKFSSMVALLVLSPFTIAYYTVKVTEVTDYVGPLCIYGFFIVTNIINRFIMSPVVNLKVEVERQEGNFRYKHMQIRTHSESIAFYRAADVELNSTGRKFASLLETLRHYVNREFLLQMSMNLCNNIGSIVSYIIIAIPVFRGDYSNMSPQDISSRVSANAFICMYLILSFNKLIQLSNQVSEIASLSHRIGELIETLLDVNKIHQQVPSKPSSDQHVCCLQHQKLINDYCNEEEIAVPSNKENLKKDVSFEIMNVSIYPSNKNDVLIQDLSLVISYGRNILISGETGSGKTSLLRSLYGLWPHVGGRIHKGDVKDFLIPQKPYLIDGSLGDQLIYPDKETSEDLIGVLKLVGLENLLSRVQCMNEPVNWSWYDELTPGEIQRISFARLFYHRPKIAFLDDSTSALSVATEAKLYLQCEAYQITLVSVGRRESLRTFHDCELILDGSGSWCLKNIDP